MYLSIKKLVMVSFMITSMFLMSCSKEDFITILNQ